ncbi:UNVERIFIED_CONTAM: hypothetical protein GTU68_045364, partial [Idotea baltica]|nr:hypothetical protein [Idotea baltica]MCL4118750.1 hypothetical protein [Idotea baltica]
ANSPEFASVPAKISQKAREEQRLITTAGKSIIEGSCAMIEAAKSLAVNPKDPPTWQALASHSKNVSDSIKNLVSSIRDKAPGQKECDDAVDNLNINIRDLDQASLSVMDESLSQYRDNNLVGYNEQVEMTCQAMLPIIEKVRQAAKSEAENLGHAVSQMSSYFTPLVNASIGCASNMTNSKRQACYLDQTKSVLECALQLMYASKESGGNSKAIHAHPEIEDSAETMKETILELLSTGESIATEAGVVSGLVESITSSINRCSETGEFSVAENESFVKYQSQMVDSAKEIIRLAQEMVSKSTVDSTQVGNLGAALSHEFNKLASNSTGAIQLAPSQEMASTIRICVQEVGQSCIDLVKCGGACQASPKNTYCQRDLAESARHVGAKVTSLLGVLKATSQGRPSLHRRSLDGVRHHR